MPFKLILTAEKISRYKNFQLLRKRIRILEKKPEIDFQKLKHLGTKCTAKLAVLL